MTWCWPRASRPSIASATPSSVRSSAYSRSFQWRTRGVFTDAAFTNRAYVEFIGPDGMVQSDDIRLGIYWHDRDTFYPSHRHNAVELYHVLSGTGSGSI